MTKDAAAFAVILSGLLGWHAHKWRYAESDLKSARARLAGALKAVWRSRGWILLAGAAVYAAAHVWLYGGG